MLQSSRECYSESNWNKQSGPNLKKMEATLSPIFNLSVLLRRSKTSNTVVGSPI